MIVREILQDPFKVVAIFDWFNDFKDTRQWLSQQCMADAYAAEVLRLLDAANDIQKRRAKLEKAISPKLPPEPPVPEGFNRWEERPRDWRCDDKPATTFANAVPGMDEWGIHHDTWPEGMGFYLEAIKS